MSAVSEISVTVILSAGFSHKISSKAFNIAFLVFALKVMKNENLHILIRLCILALCCLLAITANWNYISVLWIVGFGIFYGDFNKQIISFVVVAIFFHILPTFLNFGFTHDGYPHWYQLGVFLAIPLLMHYNGKRGKEIINLGRYGFYIFYPAHLIFLYLLNIFTPLKEILYTVIK